MKPRTTIILMILLAACIGFVVFRGLVGARWRQAAEGVEASVFDPPPVGAKELTIAPAEGVKMVFVKDGGTWNMVEPARGKADAAKVNEIVDALLDLRAVGTEERLGDEITGLGAPLWTLRLRDSKDRVYTLLIGLPLPLTKGDRTYVGVPAENNGGGGALRPAGSLQTYAAAAGFAAMLDHAVNEFRSKTILSVKPADVVRVSVEGRETFELLKDKGPPAATDRGGDPYDGWTLVTKRFTARADKDQVKALLDNLADVGVTNFVADEPESLALYGLDNPRLVVRVQVRSTEPGPSSAATASVPASQPVKECGLALGQKMDDMVYARPLDERAVFGVYVTLEDSLQPSAESLRDRRVMAPPAGEVASVEVALADQEIRLTKRDGKWHMESPFAGRANDQAVQNLIQRVTQLKAESFEDGVVSLASYGLDSPRATITLRYAGAAEPLKLLVGSRSSSGEMTFINSASSGAPVAAIRTAEAELLTAGAAAYWDTPILAVPVAEKVVGLELRNRPDGDITLLPGHAGTWAFSKPVSAPARTKPVNDVIAAVRHATATRIVAVGPSVPDKYAKDKSVISVTVTTECPPASQAAGEGVPESQPASEPSAEPVRRTYVLRVGKIGPDSFAWSEGGKITAVGQMLATFYDTFAAELRNLRVGSTSEEPVDAIRIAGERETLELRRQAGHWVCPADPHMRLDDRKVEDYIRQCDWLQCERFVSHSSAHAAKYGLDKPSVAVEFVPASGPTYRFAVAAAGPQGSASRYASASGVEGVFLLSQEAVKGLSKTAADFKE